jgi:hypothetical protein
MREKESGSTAAEQLAGLATTSVMPTNAPSRLSFVFAMVALALYAVTFLMLWLPVYAFGSDAGLLLWPIALLALLVVCVLGLLSIIYGARGLTRVDTHGAMGRGKALSGLVTGLSLLILGAPVLWFGDVPLVLLTGQSGSA